MAGPGGPGPGPTRPEAADREEGIAMNEPALFAGSAATAIFVIGQLPMLIKAART